MVWAIGTSWSVLNIKEVEYWNIFCLPVHSISGEKRSPSLAKNSTHDGWLMILGPLARTCAGVQHSSANHWIVTNKSYRKPQIDRSLMTFGKSFHIFWAVFRFFFRTYLFLSPDSLCSLSMCSHLRNYFHIICVVITPIDFVKIPMIYFHSFGSCSSPCVDKTDRLPLPWVDRNRIRYNRKEYKNL